VLAPSSGFTYAVEMKQPEGSRVSDMRLNGQVLTPDGRYRVALNNYLAAGGDSITAFTGGTELKDTGIIDVDALIAWIAQGQTPPRNDRIRISI